MHARCGRETVVLTIAAPCNRIPAPHVSTFATPPEPPDGGKDAMSVITRASAEVWRSVPTAVKERERSR